jgi:predicted TIM-barrel fold metal-dependent hydrolase
MSIFDEPKIDCHCHILDPIRFPYRDDTIYRPAGQEIGTARQFKEVLDTHGVRHALLVGPNSGYGDDNRCLLDAVANGEGRFKGIAVVPRDASERDLETLKAAGVIGVAFNATFHDVDYYRHTSGLLARLRALDMCLSLQVQHDQLLALAPLLQRSGVTVLIDHCGRPTTRAGLDQPGFRALLDLAGTGRVFVKLSGYAKFSRDPPAMTDARPYVEALLDAYTPDGCLWASDWPFLRASERVDYGPLLKLIERWLPDAGVRRKILWDTPCRVLGFPADTMAR